MSDIQRAHAITWAYRHRLAGVWPTPPPPDAYEFASCEAHEAIDAKLRTNPAYSRNNDKELSIEDELADCAMMLCTALGPDWTPTRQVYGVPRASQAILYRIAYRCAGAMMWCSAEEAEEALVLIASYPGMDDLPAHVEQRLQRIERRVMAGGA